MPRLLLALFALLLILPVAEAAFAQDDGRVHVAQRRTLMDLLFGDEEEQTPQPRREEPRRQEPRRQEPRSEPRQEQAPAERAPAATAAVPDAPAAVDKAEGATRLAVFGDSLAADLGKALERFYAEDPNLVVVPQGVGSSGFVRNDFFDWNGAIAEQIAADSFDLAVVIIGINDRQPIEAGGQSLRPLTEEWKTAYTARLNDFLGKLRAAGKPVIWIGLPPMQGSSYSTAMSEISSLQRLASVSGGAEFVDIYERFLDEEGKFSSYGPDLNGQLVRMRKDDGIHFSTAGADKLAFFLNQSIKLFYSGAGGGVGIEVADPLAGTDAAGMVRLPLQGVGQTRMIEVAGAVVPLSQTPVRAGELLVAAAPGAMPTFDLAQLMQAPAGRVDAFGVGVDPGAAALNRYAWGSAEAN